MQVWAVFPQLETIALRVASTITVLKAYDLDLADIPITCPPLQHTEHLHLSDRFPLSLPLFSCCGHRQEFCSPFLHWLTPTEKLKLLRGPFF